MPNRTDKKFGEFLYIYSELEEIVRKFSEKKESFFSCIRKCAIHAESLLIGDYHTYPHLLKFLIFLTMLTEDERNSLLKINKPVAIKLNAVFN